VNDPLAIPAYLRRDKDNQMPNLAQFKPLVYSFTLLKTADNCMYKAYRQYVKKDIPYVESKEMAWGNEVHSAFEHRLGGKPLPESMRQWEPIVAVYAERKALPEMKVGITRAGKPTGFFDNDVFVRGKIDATIARNDKALLADWKTGSSKYEDPFELEVQAVMLKARMPQLTAIAGHYVYTAENRVGKTHDLSDVNSTWARVNNKVEAIEDNMATGEWPKTRNPLCGYCPVKDCENWFDAKRK